MSITPIITIAASGSTILRSTGRNSRAPGRLPKRHYDQPRTSRHMSLQPEHGTLGARVTVPAGGRKTRAFRHLLEFHRWRYLLGLSQQARWRRSRTVRRRVGRITTQRNGRIRRQAPQKHCERWDELTQRQRIAFRDGLFDTTLPGEVEGCSKFDPGAVAHRDLHSIGEWRALGLGGQHTNDGSCEGSCTHVWNYQQALSHSLPGDRANIARKPNSPTISCRRAG